MRAVAVHPGAIVVTSRMWRTTATCIRAGGEAVLIDSPYFPDELEALPALVADAGFDVKGLLATHADFDHLLGRLAFPQATLGVGETTMERIRAEPGAAQRALRDADAEHYVERSAPLGLGGAQALPVPGYVEIGEDELELHPTDGHTADGTAFFARWMGVLVCGDYLSDVEIPLIESGGSPAGYRATLARLGALLDDGVEMVVPGHGSPLEREAALRVLEEDGAYLGALERGEARPSLPAGRDSARQRELHAKNLLVLS